MTWVTVEDTQVVVDTNDVGWKLRYSPNSLSKDDYEVAAAILAIYHHLTDPLVEEGDAETALKRARAGTAAVRQEEQKNLAEAVVHEWVIEVTDKNQGTADPTSYLLGPYSRSEAEERAEKERKRNPDLHIGLRKVMK